MKKISKCIFTILTVFILCITNVNLSHASIKQDQKYATKKYESLVKKGSGHYKIVDINGDKVKDLLWIDTSTGYYKVYTYRNKKLKCMKKFMYARGGDIYYNTKTHKIVMVRGQFGGSETYAYTAQKTSLKYIKKYSIEYDRSSGKNKTIYRINNKKVSKSTYEKSLNSQIKGSKTVRGNKAL